MNTKAFPSAIAVLGFVFLGSQALAVPVTIPSLGAAGGFAVLEIGSGNVSIANASNAGSITGNVGVNGGNLSDSGTSIIGNLVTKSGSGVVSLSGATVSGTTSQNSTLLSQAASAADAASAAAAGLASSGGGVGVSSIVLSGGTVALSAGVYNLNSLVLNNTILNLTAGANYVFNISGSLALNSSQILDATSADVLFNITGTQSGALAGGLNNESVLDGIVLAPNAGFAEAPGSVVGEIISGGNQGIGIASGGKVQGIASVPDSGSSLFLLSIGLGCCTLGVYGVRPRVEKLHSDNRHIRDT
jgi:hypothetical protein